MAEKVIDIEGLVNALNDPEHKRRELASIKKRREKKINEFAQLQKENGLIFGPVDGSGDWQAFMQEGRLIHELEKELAD